MGQGVGGERQTRQVRQASASCGAVGQGVGGERQARQVRQASAGCGAVGQGSGGEGPVRQARQVRQACCGRAEGFCLNVSLVSLVSGGPLKVRGQSRACLTCLAQVFWKVRGGGHPPARRACLTCLNVSGGFSGVRGAGRLPARRGCLRCLACLAEGPPEGQPADGLSCLACLAGGSSGVRAASDSPPGLSHSMSQAGPLGFGGRGDCQPAEGVSDVSLVSRGGPLGFGGRRPTARRACLTCLAGRPPGSAELVSVVSLVSPLGRGLARGFTQKRRQFFSRFFHALLA